MASPPATPPAEIPHGVQSWRFVATHALCEWAEQYRPGGFHPVNLGDTFGDGKYKAIRKLGEGSCSTVWLAVSSGTPRYVALKIMLAKYSVATTELSILDHLSKVSPGVPNAQRITILLDSFQHQGPNGKHQCLVFEIMGGSTASLVEELPDNKPKMFGMRQRYPVWMAKKILTHALRGLAFLHQNGVVHGDVQPGNLLFSIEDIMSTKEDQLKQDESSTSIALHRVDGKVDRWAPKNLYHPQPLYDRMQLGPEFCVKLSDLGSAFWSTNPPNVTVTPSALRAPELILRQPFGDGIDIWSFGCLIFEFLTGQALFAVMRCGRSEEDQHDMDDDHLIQLNDIIQRLPDSMMATWPRATTWYGPNHEPLSPYADERYIHGCLEDLFAHNKPDEINEEESAVICSLMRQILEYDPAKRPSAADLLSHPWFSD